MTDEVRPGFASDRAGAIWSRLAEKYGLDVEGMEPSALRAMVVREVLGGLPAHRSAEPPDVAVRP